MLTNRATLGLILTKFFQDYLLYLFMTWVPGYLVMERGFSILKMGVFASIPWIIGSIAPPLAGAISDGLMKRGVSTTVARKSVMIGSQVMAATVMVVGFISDPMIAVYCLTFSILGESAAGSVIWVLLSESAPPKYAGSIGGIMNTAGALAGVLSPAITGILVKVTGNFQMALAIGGLMLLIAAMSVGFIIPQLKPMSVELD
jgi:ACS family glucarate transporter-like MFS transporter